MKPIKIENFTCYTQGGIDFVNSLNKEQQKSLTKTIIYNSKNK